MNISQELKNELNTLSKEVFGASSRWQKLITKGYSEVVTEEVTEYVPNPEDESKEGTTRQVQVPLKFGNSGHISTTKHHTAESVLVYMKERKVKLDQIREMIKQQQKEAKIKREAEALAKSLGQEASGSAK